MKNLAEAVRRTLADLEIVIERGVKTFVEVGVALEEIRDGKLYRPTYPTFEDYCRERWGWSRQHAYRQIQAAGVAKNLSPRGDNMPVNEGQARELASLPSEQQCEVAAKVDFANTTVKELRDIVAEAKGSPVKPDTSEKMGVHFSSESEEWYTPKEILDRVVRALGRIDLDPCSNAGKNVPARKHYTQADDGLAKEWGGKVYMNPPYGRPIVAWVEKLVDEHASGRVTEAIALVPARVDTDWFRKFRDFAICFVDGRLKFSGHENSAPFPSAVVYLGGDIDKFHSVFLDTGDTWVRWER